MIPEKPEIAPTKNAGDSSKANSGVDVPELMARVGGDRDLLRDLCSMFIAELPGMIAGLRQSIDSGDCVAVSRSAHGLKGAIGVFGKGSSYQLALSLETAARASRREEFEPGFHALAGSLDHLKTQLAELILVSRGLE